MVPSGWTLLEDIPRVAALDARPLAYATAALLAVLDGELPIDLSDGTRRRVLGRLLVGVAERANPPGGRTVIREVAAGTRVSWRVTRPPTTPDGRLKPEAAPVVLADGALVLPDDVVFVLQDDVEGGHWLALLRSDVPMLLGRVGGVNA